MKKNQQIGMEKQFQKIWQCWRNSRYKLPFETPIPVGTRQEKSRKNDKKTMEHSNFTKKARILEKLLTHLITTATNYSNAS
nr:hypothetical protein [Mycoplasmopsis bovis]